MKERRNSNKGKDKENLLDASPEPTIETLIYMIDNKSKLIREIKKEIKFRFDNFKTTS